MLEINSETDDEYLGIPSADEDRQFYLRVSSGKGLTDQNRYSLVVEMNLPGAMCNHDAECGRQSCINALCDGAGGDNPEVMVGGPTETGSADFNPSQNSGRSNTETTNSGCYVDAYEPNHTLSAAVDLEQMGDGPWSAQICAEDRDLYTFNLTEVSNIEIELNFDRALGQVDALLLTEDGRALTLEDFMNGGERFYADMLSPGRYYLLVQGHTYTVENPYRFNLIARPGR
jgi:hypothetical protein